jgi:signal recognition particle GTPase
VFGKKKTVDAPQKEGFLKRLRARLNRGDSWLTYDLANLAPGGRIDEDVLEELETRLVVADVGINATGRIIESLRKRLARKELKDVNALITGLKKCLVDEGFIELDKPAPAPKAEKKAKGDNTKAGKGKVPTANPAQAAETAESVAI